MPIARRTDWADTLINNNNSYNRFDIREQGDQSLGPAAPRADWQVFNLFGRNNLGGIGSSFQTNALSNTFGQISTAQRAAAGRGRRPAHLLNAYQVSGVGCQGWSVSALTPANPGNPHAPDTFQTYISEAR